MQSTERCACALLPVSQYIAAGAQHVFPCAAAASPCVGVVKRNIGIIALGGQCRFLRFLFSFYWTKRRRRRVGWPARGWNQRPHRERIRISCNQLYLLPLRKRGAWNWKRYRWNSYAWNDCKSWPHLLRQRGHCKSFPICKHLPKWVRCRRLQYLPRRRSSRCSCRTQWRRSCRCP